MFRLLNTKVINNFTDGYSGSAAKSNGGRHTCTNRGYSFVARASVASSSVSS